MRYAIVALLAGLCLSAAHGAQGIASPHPSIDHTVVRGTP